MMKIYQQQYPTRGDLAREQLRLQGYPYSGDTLKEIERTLGEMTPEARIAFALSCAERLMQRYEILPEAEQKQFTLSWRPVIDIMWSGLEGSNPEALAQVNQALEAYQNGPYGPDNGWDGPDDDDENAAASIYAVQCFVAGKPKPAYEAAQREYDAVNEIAEEELPLDENDFAWDPNAEPSPLAKREMLPLIQAALKRFQDDLALLKAEGVTAGSLHRLKSSL